MSMIAKTTVTFTVLHRKDDPVLSGKQPIGEEMHAHDGLLGYLMREAWDGSMVGIESDGITVDVPDEQVGAELIAMGNDGTFFDDDLAQESWRDYLSEERT